MPRRSKPQQPAHGIDAVWVNGVLTYENGQPTGERAGSFVARGERAGECRRRVLNAVVVPICRARRRRCAHP